MYLDYKLDESYTPKKITIKAGTNFHDLKAVHTVKLHEPSGWISITFNHYENGIITANLIQISIDQNHQNGRDTHVRQVKIYGPICRYPM